MVKELFPKNIQAYDQECMGCQRHNKQVMITVNDADNLVFYDIFLTQDKAIELYERLKEVINDNLKPIPDHAKISERMKGE